MIVPYCYVGNYCHVRSSIDDTDPWHKALYRFLALANRFKLMILRNNAPLGWAVSTLKRHVIVEHINSTGMSEVLVMYYYVLCTTMYYVLTNTYAVLRTSLAKFVKDKRILLFGTRDTQYYKL